jgi:site-specific DNA recombinase
MKAISNVRNQVLAGSIAIYCRVSTDEQAREGVSLEEQRERLLAYCRAMGWNTEPLQFIDDGYSAKDTNRPALNKLLKMVDEKQITKIMVTKLDRMSRRLLDLLNLIDLFQHQNVSFISTSESFDTDTPSGRLTLQVLGAVAEFERERIKERVFENMVHAAKNGKWLTQSPYGYRLVNKNLVIHDPEAEIVRKIFDLYVNAGKGFFSIAKTLNKDGIPSRQNKEWNLRSIKLLLSNPVYKGTLVWNRTDSSKKAREEKDVEEWVVVPNCLPVIIDNNLWDRTQERMNRTEAPFRAKTSPHLLGGFLRCGNCGASMSISWSGWPKRYRVYRCAANKNKGTCMSKTYRADDVEAWFKKGLLQVSSICLKEYTVKLNEVAQENKKTSKGQQLALAEQRYKRKVEAYTAGLIQLDDLKEEKMKLDAEQAVIESILEPEHEIDIEVMEQEIRNKLLTVIDAIEIIPVEDAKALLSTLLEKVVLYDAGELEISFSL